MAAPYLVVDVDVEAILGQLAEVARVPLHVGDAGAAVQDDDRRRAGIAFGGRPHVGDRGAGGKLPNALVLHWSGRQARIVQRLQSGRREDADDDGGAGAEYDRPDA